MIFYLILLMMLYHSSRQEEATGNHTEKLREKLLENYDKIVMPRGDVNGSLTVSIDVIVNQIHMDEELQILVMNGLVDLKWNDYRLKWEAKNFSGLDKVHFADGELWKPDIYVNNDPENSEIDRFANTYLRVNKDGDVVWKPPSSLKVSCSMDIHYWPYDEHVCTMRLGSMSYGGSKIRLKSYHNGNATKDIWIENVKKFSHWDLLNVTETLNPKLNEMNNESYYSMNYTFYIKRDSPTFQSLLTVSAVVIPLFLVLQFALSEDYLSRTIIGLASSLFIIIEMIYLKLLLYRVGQGKALIVTYFNQLFVVSILLVCLNCLLSRLSSHQNPLLKFAPPKTMKKLLTGPFSRFLCLRQHASKVETAELASAARDPLDTPEPKSFHQEWFVVAKAVDRISLIIYLCFQFISYLTNIAPLK